MSRAAPRDASPKPQKTSKLPAGKMPPALSNASMTARPDAQGDYSRRTPGETALLMLFYVLNAPVLLRSLFGGSRSSREALLRRLGLPDDAIPAMGGWKADVGFLTFLTDYILAEKPQYVVEFGAGASTLVIAKALELAGRTDAEFVSFEQHRDFCEQVRSWLERFDLSADVRHAPLQKPPAGWPGMWYAHKGLGSRIDLLVIDGPHWAIHPFTRGAAATLFDRIKIGGAVLLDDAARAGERFVIRRWRREWPNFEFSMAKAGSKGLLIGRRIR